MIHEFPEFGESAPPCLQSALSQGIAPVGRCDACERSFYYPRTRCPHCFASTTTCVPVTGPFTVRSAVIVHRQQNPVFDAPDGVMMIAAELSEDVTLIAEGDGWEAGRPSAGASARYDVMHREDGTPVPVLRPWNTAVSRS